MTPRVALFTRYPDPGRAKTRLIPALGADGTAALHRRLTEPAVSVLRASALPFELRVTGAPAEHFRTWLGEDVAVVDQGPGDLGGRLLRATGTPPVILLGADVPDLAVRHLQAAAAALQTHRTAIGSAEDGGDYLLGLAEPMPFLFAEMPWSTDAVIASTMQRFEAQGVAPAVLETLADLDRPDDLRRWPGLLA